ncbi:hypothetical protein E1A91_A06G119700v1 [Gossypium mustelinum]|uniref:Uncharacterized protein n=1 Tax=Gossypium mustelinum TaxID=34275 RepID=A0A5D2YVI3_GOSMU|nr:hypothetical protein E1A91_A06G119700v1 [Gossypium mustelinum]
MERSDQMFKVRAAELRKILVELGPAYIKIAQAVSSRPGLDALGLATLDSLTSAATTRIPFTGSSVSFMSKEDMINLRTFHRMFLLAGLESNKKSFELMELATPTIIKAHTWRNHHCFPINLH